MAPATPARKAPARKRVPARAKAAAKSGPAKSAGANEANDLLGEGFLVGVATSGYQIEGGFNGTDEPHNNWAGWEAMGRIERSGIACDFWRHPEEALDRAAALGCNAFRLSVEWARLEPRPDVFDDAALERYAEILSLCVARGLAPMVTLHHFTNPVWQGEEFWLRPGSPDVFARHVRRILPALVPYCRHWITINEPNIVMLMGWVEGASPPGRRMAVSDAYCVLDNLLCAHVLAADVIAEMQPDSEVTMNTSSSSIYEHDRMLVDLLGLRESGIDPSRRRHLRRRAPGRARRRVPAAARRGGVAAPVLRRGVAVWDGPPAGEHRRLGRAARPRAAPGAAACGRRRRSVAACACRSTPRASTGTTRSRATPCGCRDGAPPGVAVATGRSGAPCGTRCRIQPPWGRGAPPRRRCARGCRCGSSRTGWRRGCAPGGPSRVTTGWTGRGTCASTWVRSRTRSRRRSRYAAYLHWSLVDNYEWGTYEPRFGLFGLDRSDPDAVRWLDTDSAGADAAGEFSRVVAGLRRGDRSVLGPA